MDAKELSEIVGGKLFGKNREVSGFHFDSREIKPGQVFIPIIGRRDGHQFIEGALEKGAAGFLTSKDKTPPEGKFAIRVSDTFEAFRKVALFKRDTFGGTVVGITGSVGKTTTKELLSFVLSEVLRVYSNVKSYNNLLGLTYTVANLPKKADVYVQELGTNAPGEIGELSLFLRPQIGIITAVERAHLQGFKRFENLISEKFSLTEFVDVAVVPVNFSPYSKSKETITFGKEGDVYLTYFNSSPEGTRFGISVFKEEVELHTRVPGFSVVNASMVAGAFLKLLGLPLSLLEKVSEFQPPQMRMNVYTLPKGVLIDDSYNANPASFRNALEVLSFYGMPKVVIAGEMLELGDSSSEEHYILGREMESRGIDELIAFGNETKKTVKAFKGKAYHFTDREEFLNFLSEYPFEGKAVLVKGSRGNRLEEAVRIIRKRLES